MSARLAPSTVAHVLQLVGSAYLDLGQGSSSCRRLRRAKALARPVGSRAYTTATRVRLKAQEVASPEAPEEAEERRSELVVRTPRKPPPPPRERVETPAWAWVEKEAFDALFVKKKGGKRPTASLFRKRFEGLGAVTPTLLLPVERLWAVFDVWNSPATTEADWHWLNVKLKAIRETQPDFADLPGSEAMLRHLRALTLAKNGEWESACFVMSTAVKAALIDARGIDHYPIVCVPVAEAYIESALKADRIEDIADVVRYGGSRFQKLLCTLPGGSRDLVAPSQRVRTAFQKALERMEDPWGWILNQIGDMPEGRTVNSVYHTALVFLSTLIANEDRTLEAFALWKKIASKFNSTTVSHQPLTRMATNLANEGYVDAAQHVIDGLREKGGQLPHNSLSSIMWFYANQGKPSETLVVWDEINLRHRPTSHDRLAVATSFAVNGQVDAARQALKQLGAPEDSVETLRLLHRAAVVAEDDYLASQYLDKIAHREPTLKPFESQLILYAQQGKTDDAISVFGRIVELNLKPTLRTYTTFISVFANAGDYVNANLVFKSMQQAGHVADSAAWCALLNAYVEAGAWEEAARRVEEVPPELTEDANIIGVLLKAYVLAAAPLEPILRLFRTITLPSEQAWAMVIQAACDNDNMVLARSLFMEMDAATKVDTLAPHPTVYIFSILLTAYLRLGDRESAHAVYDTMAARKVIPTSVTYGIITNSFARAPGESSFEQAHNFAQSVYNQISPGERTAARGAALENVYTPLLMASVRNGDLTQARRYYDLIIANGGNSRALSTKMMEAHRQAGELRPLYRVWLRLFGAACRAIPRIAGDHDPSNTPTRARNNVLAIPFSIAISAFGEAKLHDRLKALWRSMRNAGFGRDSQNYNHYSVALARTGDLEGAFHIVERVLLPRYDEVVERYYRAMRGEDGRLAAVDADSTPDDIIVQLQDGDDVFQYKPLDASLYDQRAVSSGSQYGLRMTHSGQDAQGRSYDEGELEDEYAFDEAESQSAEASDSSASFPDPSTPSMTKGTDDVAEHTHRPPNRRHQFITESAPASLVEGDGENTVDLSILRQWRPSDIMWRPSIATMDVLDHAYAQLEDLGQRAAWVGVSGDDDGIDEGKEPDHEPVHLADFGVTVKSTDGSPARMSPRMMLARLNRKYARTVGLIMFHRKKRRAAAEKERVDRGNIF